METERDPKELLPFCTRCFGVGIQYEEPRFCHTCGSQGTCVPMEREYILYLQDNISKAVENAIKSRLVAHAVYQKRTRIGQMIFRRDKLLAYFPTHDSAVRFMKKKKEAHPRRKYHVKQQLD